MGEGRAGAPLGYQDVPTEESLQRGLPLDIDEWISGVNKGTKTWKAIARKGGAGQA